MKRIALIFSFKTSKTTNVAKEIVKIWNTSLIDELNAEEITGKIFKEYDYLILGVPTWFEGELPNYWDEFIPELETLDLKGKKIAIFGNGDQINYPENFVDGIGLMAEILENLNATIVGFTSTEGYQFEKSKGLRGDKFFGLALDIENQSEQNTSRITQWIKGLKKEFI